MARLEGWFQTHTARAVCVRLSDDPTDQDADCWVPLSVVGRSQPDPEEATRGDPIELEVADWWAEKEGLD